VHNVPFCCALNPLVIFVTLLAGVDGYVGLIAVVDGYLEKIDA
jgi:hypothetical protein